MPSLTGGAFNLMSSQKTFKQLKLYIMKTSKIEFTRVNNDVNGNPRYVCHFLNLNTNEEKNRTGKEWIDISEKYRLALNRAKKIGGRKFHNKQYGGGIVFGSVYSLSELEQKINELLND